MAQFGQLSSLDVICKNHDQIERSVQLTSQSSVVSVNDAQSGCSFVSQQTSLLDAFNNDYFSTLSQALRSRSWYNGLSTRCSRNLTRICQLGATFVSYPALSLAFGDEQCYFEHPTQLGRENALWQLLVQQLCTKLTTAGQQCVLQQTTFDPNHCPESAVQDGASSTTFPAWQVGIIVLFIACCLSTVMLIVIFKFRERQQRQEQQQHERK
jgi:hypothetical protein